MALRRQCTAVLLGRLRSLDSCTNSLDGCVHHGIASGCFQDDRQSTLSVPECSSHSQKRDSWHHTQPSCVPKSFQMGRKWKRQHSSSSVTTAEDIFIYNGPLSQTLKNLKRLSISGAALSIFGSPILVVNTAEAMPFAAQASICFTIASFGIFTTSLLHWFTSPYIHQLNFNRQLREGEAKTLSIFAQTQITTFQESEIKYPDTMRPQVTFEVRGKPFYLDANAFLDKDLLMRLSPPDPAAEAVSVHEANSNEQS